MKSMKRKESKKIAVMAAVIVGFMMFAFMPMASATVTSFTVTPGTGIAGAVDSYNALVTTDGVTSINITIPQGFIAVTPTTGGELIAEVTFWNSSTKTYYGSATIKSNNANPTTRVDIYCKFGGDEVTTIQTVNYAAGATNTFEAGFPSDTSSAIIKLPTEALEGSIKISINSTAFQLDDVMTAIGQFVRNPAAGIYVFSADDGTGEVDANVEIRRAGAIGPDIAIYQDGWWALKYGPENNIPNFQPADKWLAYGVAGWTPVAGDFNNDGTGDIAVFENGWWALKYGPVDEIPDFQSADKWLAYGIAGWTPVAGDFNNDGIDDIAVFKDGWWALKYGPVNAILNFQGADKWLAYGGAGGMPVVGDFNDNGIDDIAMFQNGWWALKYGPVNAIANSQPADKWLAYGAAAGTPLVGDCNNDDIEDIAIFQNGWWASKYGPVNAIANFQPADHWLAYGAAAGTPLVGDFGNP
nr:hypothetical secreted protein, containing FG-GAP repeats [uncultured archaeon]